MMDFLAAVAAILLVCVWVIRSDQRRAARKDDATEQARHRERVLRLVNESREWPRTHWWR